MPGPGSYDVKSFVEKIQNENKSFVIGKKENHEMRKTLSILSYNHSLAFNFPSNPGPGYYNDQTNMNKTGTYYNSKFKNSGS